MQLPARNAWLPAQNQQLLLFLLLLPLPLPLLHAAAACQVNNMQQ
jgi:hypothetical protein